MALDSASIHADLATAGRTLAFCDETDITPDATAPRRARNHLLGALAMASNRYGGMRDGLSSKGLTGSHKAGVKAEVRGDDGSHREPADRGGRSWLSRPCHPTRPTTLIACASILRDLG
jgi:hypothetical protein